MTTPSLEKAIRALLEPEIAGGLSAFDDVEILLAAWKELHRERSEMLDRLTGLRAVVSWAVESERPADRLGYGAFLRRLDEIIASPHGVGP